MTMDDVKIGEVHPSAVVTTVLRKITLRQCLVASLCIVVIMHVVGGGGGMQSSVLAAHTETAWCRVSTETQLDSSYGCEHCEQWGGKVIIAEENLYTVSSTQYTTLEHFNIT